MISIVSFFEGVNNQISALSFMKRSQPKSDLDDKSNDIKKLYSPYTPTDEAKTSVKLSSPHKTI